MVKLLLQVFTLLVVVVIAIVTFSMLSSSNQAIQGLKTQAEKSNNDLEALKSQNQTLSALQVKLKEFQDKIHELQAGSEEKILAVKKDMKGESESLHARIDSEASSYSNELRGLKTRLEKSQNEIEDLKLQSKTLPEIKTVLEAFNAQIKDLEAKIITAGTSNPNAAVKANVQIAILPEEKINVKYPFKLTIDKDTTVHIDPVGTDKKTALTLVVVCNGKQVLSLNALGQNQYEYYRKDPGTYRIYLESFNSNAGFYQQCSNSVSYEISIPVSSK
ncbi:MAG: hypothetical protein HZA48_02580 [Planctomycetes bacterium]|nr:hypothetical protein [Planctomycetota bacterium]